MKSFNQAPPDSIVSKLWDKRNKTDVCFVLEDSSLGNVLNRNTLNIFLLSPSYNTDYVANVIQTFTKKNTFTS